MVKIFCLFSHLFFLANSLHAVPWPGATSYIHVLYLSSRRLLHYPTTLLSQRVGPLRFVGVNKQVVRGFTQSDETLMFTIGRALTVLF